MAEPFRVLSLGAGIDSTTLLLMSDRGDLPRLDAAVFADTIVEPQAVYDTLEWLTSTVSIPIYRTSRGHLGDDILANQGQDASRLQYYPPFFVKKANGKAGAPLHRRCTREYKIRPIHRYIRTLLGKAGRVSMRGVKVEQWIGFSLDDLSRTFCSEVPWITNVYPLILPKRMHRRDCVRWLTEHGYPLPAKSSCTFCPFHRNTYWREMRDHRPEEWAATVAFEARMQATPLAGVSGTPYIHSSLVPLALAPIDEEVTDQEPLFCFACNT